MIGRPEIVQRSLEWGLREDVVEKDYVLGWVLWGIGSDPLLGNGWVFKGGTCLKKCRATARATPQGEAMIGLGCTTAAACARAPQSSVDQSV